MKLISRISSLRPQAYVIVFTDSPKVIGALGVNFGVYCYSKAENKLGAKEFIAKYGAAYGHKSAKDVKILRLDVQGGKIAASRISDLN